MPDNSMTPTSTNTHSIRSGAGLVEIPIEGASASLFALQIGNKPFVALKPMCDAIGIDVENQRRKLKAKSWATSVMSTAVAPDGKSREMFMIDRRTMTMWLATLDENRIADNARPIVRAFQAQAADALDAYFHEGGAINPNASAEQLDRVTQLARGQMEIIRLAEGIIDPKHLEAKARIVLARGLGEAPELDLGTTPLYAQTYLEEKGLRRDRVKSISSRFGMRVKASYVLMHGAEPKKYPLATSNGQVRMVNAYVESDRHLMDEVWETYYAEGELSA